MESKILAITIALLVLYAPIRLSLVERIYVAMFGWHIWGVIDMLATWGLYVIALILLWRLVKWHR